jgi:hypothetical protein
MMLEQRILAGDRGSVSEVFVAFLKLGLTSFEGPIAHLGYFRESFVVRRRWRIRSWCRSTAVDMHVSPGRPMVPRHW